MAQETRVMTRDECMEMYDLEEIYEKPDVQKQHVGGPAMKASEEYDVMFYETVFIFPPEDEKKPDKHGRKISVHTDYSYIDAAVKNGVKKRNALWADALPKFLAAARKQGWIE